LLGKIYTPGALPQEKLPVLNRLIASWMVS